MGHLDSLFSKLIPKPSSGPVDLILDGGFSSKDNLKDAKTLGVQDDYFQKKRGPKVSEMTLSSWVYKRLPDFRAGIEGLTSSCSKIQPMIIR